MGRNMMGPVGIWAVLLWAATISRGAYVEDKWILSDNLGFNHMVRDSRTGKLYVAAVNKIFVFDDNLTHLEDVTTGPKMDNKLCQPRPWSCELNLTATQAYNKGLVIDYTNERLIACTSLYQGTCEKYHLDNIKEKDPSSYKPVVANNATATTVLFIAPGPLEDDKGHQAKALYIGAQRTNSGRSSFRDLVPAFASRKLNDFKLVYKGLAQKTEIVIDSQHRDQFPVYYIYGFGSDNFSYMIVVQKQSTSSENFITKIIRVCQKDKDFLSYAEVQLQCRYNGTVYNLARAAHLGQASTNLAKKLGIPEYEDVLYATFSKSKPSSADPLRESAVCIYPMRYVRKKFTENIQSCFSGTGNTGPAHIGNPSPCRSTPDLKVDDVYCGQHDVNYPIDGTDPITTQAAVTFDFMASAITIVHVHHYTVAFVGTDSGRLLKMALETQHKGILYDTIPIDEGSRIFSDMFVDKTQIYLYVMTDFKLLKIKVYECSQYKTCSSCIGAEDPYCGWCSLENKCSLRKDCMNNEQALRWLPYEKTCTEISEVNPPKIQKEKDKTTMLELKVTNLPEFSKKYQCVFSSEGYKIPTTEETMTQHSDIIKCETPVFNQLPPIPTGKDHIVMNLTVQIGGLHFVSTKFTFYDCSTHSGCSGCTLSEFDCTWCIENNACTHDPEAKCADNMLVYGKNVQGGGPHGPDKCPRIESMREDSPDAKILVPSGKREKITVKAINLYDFQTKHVECYFVSLSVSVPATVTQEPDGKTHIIECDSVDFTYSLKTNMSKVPFHIYWDKRNTLDNPAKIQVTMYKCDVMAKTCGECIVQPDYYKCGWCEDTCSIQDQCRPSPKQWLPNNGTCANVTITRISPVTGPNEGGTLLTIDGVNLGKKFSDISGGITVAGVACNPIEELYRPPNRIVCKTEPYSSQKTGTVHLTIRNLYSTDATQRFTYVDPKLLDISPDKGPVSGGTIVTITGSDLDAGTEVIVNFGAYSCKVTQRTRTRLTCKTSGATEKTESELWARFDEQNVSSTSSFTYVENPEIETVLPIRAIVSGGITITVTGKYFDTIQTASMVTRQLAAGQRRRRSVKEFVSDCEKPKTEVNTDKVFYCFAANVTNSTVRPDVNGVKFGYGFMLNNLFIDRSGGATGEKFTIYPDPVFEDFAGNREKSYQSKTDNYLTINGRNLNLGFNSSDVIVRIGVAFCNVTSIDKHGNQLNCKPPKTQPSSAQNSRYPEVVVQVGRNLTRLVGYLKYEKAEFLPLPVIIGLGVGGGVLVLIVIFLAVLWCIKKKENTTMKKKWQIQMDNLEVKVAKECKEAFAELQTDMTELTSDHFGQVAIPFWDYRTYCMRVLFPQDEDSHAVIREIEVDPSRRDDIEHGLKLFSQLIGNKTFLLTFVRTLEANKKFSMRERVQVASLISVALQTRMEYATEVLKTLLAELIEKAVEGKNHPKLLLRRTESVAEKMLTNWFTFLLYKFLRECAGEPLFMLYQAIKQQTCKGPVDFITSEARYSLSEDKLIRQQIDYNSLTVHVHDMDQFQQSHAVKVLDCDTISQVKEKILDAIYKNAPFSSRPARNSVDLVLFSEKPDMGSGLSVQRLILSDIDDTTKQEGDFKRYNCLAHYKVPDGAYMGLVAKQSSSFMDLTMNGDKFYGSKFEYKRLIGKDDSYTSTRSPSLNRTASPQSVNIDIENNSSNGVKYYHLVRQHDQENAKEGDRGSKMVSEIYLTRLLATKGTLQQFVDDLFERIFSTINRSTSLPLAIKYMFDFLDDQALLHNIQDADVVHTWKSNSLPLRFWVNVIKNPNFVFDIYKSNIVDSCLSVVAQNFMDSCSMSEHKLGKDSPSSKLLYAKDIPTYKNWVDRYYTDIKMMPAISDQDMTAMMADESRAHQDEFNISAALYELYKYVGTYQEDLREALEEDEFAKKNKLNFKLEQVRQVMEGDKYH